MHLFPPPSDYRFTFRLSSGRARSSTPNRTFSFFTLFTGLCRYIFIPIPSLKPSYFFQVLFVVHFLPQHLFFSWFFFLRPLLSCIRCIHLSTLSRLGFLLCPSILSRLPYPTLSMPALSSPSSIRSYRLWMANSLLTCSLCYIVFLILLCLY